MKTPALILLAVVCAVQWYVPLSTILHQEEVLTSGKRFHFKTAPVDPYDPFRGKYITLQFDEATFTDDTGGKWERGERIFVEVASGNDGFAHIAAISETEPDEGKDFFEAKILYVEENLVHIAYPFDRFYLDESKASDAEKVYQDNNRDSSQVAYAVIRLKAGTAVLEDVIINDRSIVDVVRELQNK